MLSTIRYKQTEMVETENSMNIPLIFKEEFIVYKYVRIAEQEGHEQVGAFSPAALYCSNDQVVIENEPRTSS